MDIRTEAVLEEALKFFETWNPEEALKLIYPLFGYEENIDCQELMYTNRCCMFWIDSKRRLESIEDPFERCMNLLPEWKSYLTFISKESNPYEPTSYSIQKGFFSAALNDFKKLFEERDAFQRAEVFKNAGICYKELGDYENACSLLTEATSILPTSASAIAELADCYCLCGDERIGKLLFREAFFLNPDAIDLDFLESELIKFVIKTTKSKGYTGRQLQYWIPIYGILNGIFTIKRDLSSQEVAKLMNSVFAMESEYKDSSCDTGTLVPKLLNSYFWLLDHYMRHRENPARINELLLKIKILDSSIYEMYTR